jgi:hypothetical protein
MLLCCVFLELYAMAGREFFIAETGLSNNPAQWQ